MPNWNSSEYQRKLIYPLILLLISSLYLSASINSFLDSTGSLVVLNLFVSLIVAIYIVGRLYGEINANKDYIEISTSGIKFRETPGLGHGWLPISKMLMFEDV
ncbi:MAG: hypothetical protein ACXAC2_13110, partial [Candidatus Kariarchaeaceae archaeon]